MKEELINEMLLKLSPYMKEGSKENVKMILTIALGNYEIRKLETQVTIYEEDKNTEILKRFLLAKIARGCTDRTIHYYKTYLKRILFNIGKPYDEITSDDVRVYLALRVQQDGISKCSANNDRRALSSFYTWLQKEEILLRNPMGKVEAIKETKSKKKAFTKMEMELLKNACQTSRETCLYEVLKSTWCRVAEVSGIKISDIDGNKVLVHGKGDKDRIVYLTASAELAIQNYLQDREDSNPYLFPKAKYAGQLDKMHGKGMSKKELSEWYKNKDMVDDKDHTDKGTVENIIRKIGKRAEVQNSHPHRFRRTGATMALRNGMPLTTVSKLLGHANIGVTQIYLDISDEELAQAHDRYVI